MRKLISIAASLAMIVSLAMVFAVAPVSAAGGTVVYDSTVSPLPPSLVSQPFQAQQTAEFGDLIQFAGTSRVLNTVTVTMVTWAPHSDYPEMADEGWTHPITLNIYSVDNSGPVPAVGTLLATNTTSFLIPWRPAASPSCTGGRWLADDNICYNGYAFNITFDMTDPAVTLPDQIIYGIAYNTQTWGYAPIGTPGPYNSLNVGLNDASGPSVGTDVNPDAVFWNTETAAWYADGGADGVGIFRQDTNWTGYVPAVQFTAATPAPTTADQCKKDGWHSSAILRSRTRVSA